MNSAQNNAPIAAAPEAQLLLACATTAPTPDRTARARACLPRIADWDGLIALAGAHGVLPLVYRYLTAQCASELPAEAAGKLRLQVQLNALRNRHLTNLLVRYARAFEQAGVRAITFKGPVLAALAYGEIELRQFTDLDFLVAACDLATVAQILTAAGYRSHLLRRDAVAGGYFQEFEEAFFGRDGLDVIDVHWRLTPKAYPFAPAEEGVRERARPFSLGEGTVLTLAPEDLFLYLCVHGAKHGWNRLGWICDIAQLLAARDLIDLSAVLQRAEQCGSRRMVLLAIYLADRIGGAVAEEFLAAARGDRTAAAAGERVLRALFRRVDGSEPAFDPWVVPLRAIAGGGARAKYVVGRLLAPTMGDFELIPLPAALFPLYWLIRPIRMAVQYGPRLVRGVFDAAVVRAGQQPR